jgi:hypothetical protein
MFQIPLPTRIPLIMRLLIAATLLKKGIIIHVFVI